jgi:hypothetical protein
MVFCVWRSRMAHLSPEPIRLARHGQSRCRLARVGYVHIFWRNHRAQLGHQMPKMPRKPQQDDCHDGGTQLGVWSQGELLPVLRRQPGRATRKTDRARPAATVQPDQLSSGRDDSGFPATAGASRLPDKTPDTSLALHSATGEDRPGACGDTLGTAARSLPMKRFKPSSRISVLPMILSAVLAAGLSTQVASQTPADPAAGGWKITKVVSVDACNTCVQVRGCDRKNTECTTACSNRYPPNDPHGAKCLDACTRAQTRCVREAQKACQACQP